MIRDFVPREFLAHCSDKDISTAVMTYGRNMLHLLDCLQKVRDIYCEPIIINSGYRTPSHNKYVGGVDTSQHLTFSAADIRPYYKSNKGLNSLLEAVAQSDAFGQVIKYPTFIHVGLRCEKYPSTQITIKR